MNFRLPLIAALVLLAGACTHREQTSPHALATDARSTAASARATSSAGSPVLPVAYGHRERFAAAPDHGALVTYPSTPVLRRDGAYTSFLASISEAHARDAIGSVLTVPLPSGEQLRFRYERHIEHPNGDWTWIGAAVGANGEQAIVTFGAKAAFGTIGQAGEQPWRLTVQNGVSWLIRTDAAQLALINNGATRPTSPDYIVPPGQIAAATRRTASGGAISASSATSTAAATAANTVDLVIGYTPGFVDYYGGDSQAQTRLNYMVDITNEAYVNSGVNARVRLVKTLQVSYADNTSNDSALEALTGFKAPSTQTTPDPAFSALRAARDQYGADLVSLVRRFQTPESDGCGIAWLIGGGQSPIDSSDAFFGYSVVGDGKDAGTDGKNYYCREETLAHELGHNMGAQHDRATAQGSDGTLSSDEYGRYPYSFGYKTTSTTGNFYTIMAYGDSGQTNYRIFSNPRSTFCGGLACGVDNQSDNARTLSQTVPTIATFRAMVVPLSDYSRPSPGAIRGMSNKCLDATNYGTTSGTPIQVWTCLGGSQQQWSFVANTGAIKRDATTRVLDIFGYGTTNGSQIQLWDYLGGANQQWYFNNTEIVGAGGTVLDAVGASSANGTRLQLWVSTGGTNQRWTLKADGTIRGPGNSCLDVAGFGTFNGVAVQLWTCSGTQNQKWQLGANGTIIGYGNKCLEAANGDTSNGTAVRMWDCNGGAHQSWMLRGEIRSVASNRCLDDPAAGERDGSRVHIWDCHGGSNQRWEYVSK